MNTINATEALLVVTTQQIQDILDYRDGGGLERVAETAERLAMLGELQVALLKSLNMQNHN